MKFTSVLFKQRYFPKGSVWRGKYRFVKRVQPWHIDRCRRDLHNEEINMFYLRHPYLSQDEYKGMSKHLQVHEKFIAGHLETQQQRFRRTVENRTLENLLGHLKVNENWDV